MFQRRMLLSAFAGGTFRRERGDLVLGGMPLWKIFSLHRVLPAEDSAGNKTEESSQGEGR